MALSSTLTLPAIAKPVQWRATLFSENLATELFQLRSDLKLPRQHLEQLPALNAQILRSSFQPDTTPQARYYRIEIEAKGAHFALLLSWPQPNVLELHVQDNWVPSDWILQALHDELRPVLKQLEKIGVQGKLQFKKQSTALQWVFSPGAVAGYWSPEGDLWIHLLPPQVPGTTALRLQADLTVDTQDVSPNTGEDVPQALDLKAELKHRFDVQLTEAQVKNLVLSGESIHERLEALTANLQGSSHFNGTLSAHQLTGHWQGQFKADLEQLQINGSRYTNLHTSPFHWQWQWPYQNVDDFDVWPALPPLPPLSGRLAPRFMPARLQYTIDGPLYLKTLRAAIARARYRVQQEVFVFYPGQSTRDLSRLYWRKAAGLQEKGTQLVPDPYAPQGIAIELMHNHKMSPAGAQSVQQLFAETRHELLAQLKAQGLEDAALQRYAQRMDHHLHMRALTRGIVKINHRKQVIIDNSMAFVGGFNMADHYLSPQGFHDIMYQVTGPIIGPLQAAFDSNWQALAPGADPFAPVQPATDRRTQRTLSAAQTQALMDHLPRSHKSPFYNPHVALLLHDHEQNTLKPAILQLIQKAQHTLRLEQAYVRDKAILEALKAAKKRGVNIEWVVSYYNDEILFERLNLASMISLHQAEGTGKIDTWLYRGYHASRQTERNNPSYMVHTKYVSADGREAIVGSTNLIPRSLQSPFYGLMPEYYAASPALFNEELGLWVKDRDTVSALDQDLVIQDQQARSQKVNVGELKALLNARGGLWPLLGDQLKGLFS